MGSKGKKLENDIRARGKYAGEKEERLSGLAAGGYEDFASTGGITDAEKELMRRRTASGISSQYSRLRDALQRRAAVQGGYAPGLSSSEAKLQRQAANATGEALTGTELGIAQERRAGRLSGLGGLTNLAQGYQNEITNDFGLRTELEKKRRGVLANIAGGLNIAKGVGSLATGF